MSFVLRLAAFLCFALDFVLATLGDAGKIAWIPLGLAFWVLSTLVDGGWPGRVNNSSP